MKKILVVKCGSNVVAENGGVSKNTLKLIAQQVLQAREHGYDVVLVSSGAVACGKKFVANFVDDDVKSQQVASAYGQPILMQCWQEVFFELGLSKVGQCLETHIAFQNGMALKAIKNILADGGVPVVNENDAVNIEELLSLQQGGDNDMLAAIVASKMQAEKLILLTDVDGLYASLENRQTDKVIHEITEINSEILALAELLISDRSTGMGTKLQSAKYAVESGVDVWIANGRKEVILDILAGKQIGTHCVAKQ